MTLIKLSARLLSLSLIITVTGGWGWMLTEEQKEEVLIFFFCDQSPRKEYPLIAKTLEDSLGLRKLFDSAENR